MAQLHKVITKHSSEFLVLIVLYLISSKSLISDHVAGSFVR